MDQIISENEFLRRLDAKSQECAQLQKQIIEIQATGIKQLQAENQQIKEELSEVNDKLRQLSDENAVLYGIIRELTAKNNAIKQENDDFERANRDIVQEVIDKDEENSRLTDKIDMLEDSIISLNSEIKYLEGVNKQLNNTVEDLTDVGEELELTKKKNEMLEITLQFARNILLNYRMEDGWIIIKCDDEVTKEILKDSKWSSIYKKLRDCDIIVESDDGLRIDPECLGWANDPSELDSLALISHIVA